MAEASVESRITQTGSVRSVAATIIGTVTLLVALLSIEALRTACAQETSQQLEKLRSCRGGKKNGGENHLCLGEREPTHHPGTSLH